MVIIVIIVIKIIVIAPVVQWREQARPKRLMVVRFRPGAPFL